MKFKHLLIAIIAAFTVASITGCSSSPENMIVGKWHLKDIQYKSYYETEWAGSYEGSVTNIYHKFKSNGTYEEYLGNTLTGTSTWSYNDETGTITLNGHEWLVEELTSNSMIIQWGTYEQVRILYDK